MSFTKSIKRKQQLKDKKNAQKALTAITKKIQSSPKNCCVCNAPFDAKNDIHLDTWIVNVSQTAVSLYCAECHDKQKTNF